MVVSGSVSRLLLSFTGTVGYSSRSGARMSQAQT